MGGRAGGEMAAKGGAQGETPEEKWLRGDPRGKAAEGRAQGKALRRGR